MNDFNEFEEGFKNMSNEKLIDAFNRDAGKMCWVAARGRFHDALRKEFDNRGFDYSALLTGGRYSLKNKIKLIGGKIVILIEEFKIPDGLYKCKTCGEYKGRAKTKRLTVTCLCDGILCPGCKKNKLHRPISNSYDTKTNTIWHHAWFTGLMRCDKCSEIRKKLQEEDRCEEERWHKMQEGKVANKARWNKKGEGVKCVFNTVLIKFSAITKRFPGGFEGFEERYEGGFQTDGKLIAFCYMGNEYHELINELVESGLRYSEIEHDFCFFDHPFFEFKRFKGRTNTYDFIEYSWRGKDEDKRVWAKLKK